MWTEFYAQRPCAVGLVRWPTGRFTVVVKVTLQAAATQGAALVVAPTQDAPTLDVADASGVLVQPSDFAPYKPLCDVLVVGAEVLSRAAEGLVAIGRAEKRVAARATLGARETFCPGGDPTDPAALRVWSAPQADFSRFHAAPPDQRIAHPRPPFTVVYRRGDAWMDARFEGPEPVVRVLDATTQQPVASVALALDTILVAPRESRVSLVWRGVSAWPTSPTVLVVDFDRPGAAQARSFSGRVVEPHHVRVERAPVVPPEDPTTAEQTHLVDPAGARAAALPFGPPSSRPATSTRLISALPPSAGGPALPFVRAEPGDPSTAPAPSPPASAPPMSLPPVVTSAGTDERPVAPSRPGATVVVPQRTSIDETGVSSPRAKAFTLPFKRIGGAPPSERREGLDAAGFAELRKGAAVESAWASDGETRAVQLNATRATPALPSDTPPPPMLQRPPSRDGDAPPFAMGAPLSYAMPASPSTPAPPSPSFAPPPSTFKPVAAAPPPPPASAPAAAAAPSSPPPEPAVRGPSDDTMKAIQREVWKGERPLADILRDHGVTETDWREAKRTRAKR